MTRKGLIDALDYQLSSDEKFLERVAWPIVALAGVAGWKVFDGVPNVTSWSHVGATAVVVVSAAFCFLLCTSSAVGAAQDQSEEGRLHAGASRYLGFVLAFWTGVVGLVGLLTDVPAIIGGWWLFVAFAFAAVFFLPELLRGRPRGNGRRGQGRGWRIVALCVAAPLFALAMYFSIQRMATFEPLDVATGVVVAIAWCSLIMAFMLPVYWLGHMNLVTIRQSLFLETIEVEAALARLRDQSSLGWLVGADPREARGVLRPEELQSSKSNEPVESPG